MQAGVDLQQHDRPGPQHLILIGLLEQAVLPEAPGRVVQSVGFATRLIHAQRFYVRHSSGTIGVRQAWFSGMRRESRT